MDWEVLQKKDSERIDNYFRCLYYIEVSNFEQEETVKKITRKLSSASHGAVIPKPKKDDKKDKDDKKRKRKRERQ